MAWLKALRASKCCPIWVKHWPLLWWSLYSRFFGYRYFKANSISLRQSSYWPAWYKAVNISKKMLIISLKFLKKYQKYIYQQIDCQMPKITQVHIPALKIYHIFFKYMFFFEFLKYLPESKLHFHYIDECCLHCHVIEIWHFLNNSKYKCQ